MYYLFAVVSVCSGVLLLALRAFMPEVVVGGFLGFALGLTSSSCAMLCVAERKRLSLGYGSPWRALLIISAFAIAVAIDLILALGFFRWNVDVVTAVALSLFGVIIALGWWRLLTVEPDMRHKENVARPVLFVLFALVVAALMIKKYAF